MNFYHHKNSKLKVYIHLSEVSQKDPYGILIKVGFFSIIGISMV